MANKPTKKLNHKNLKLSHKNLLINPKSRGKWQRRVQRISNTEIIGFFI